MKRIDFNNAMVKLIRVYGERSFPEERRDIIFNRVGAFVRQDEFIEGLDDLIAEHKWAPVLSDFLDVFRLQLNNYKTNVELPECSTCNSTGVILKEKKNAQPGTAVYAFQCHCLNGKHKAGGMPRYDYRYSREFTNR